MRSFLLKNNKPIIAWGILPDNIMYQGIIPTGYDLAVTPDPNMIIVDVDRHGHKDGFNIINKLPLQLQAELVNTFNYPTKHDGRHFWFVYTGDKVLMNKASGLGIDLRIGPKKDNSGGYVKWHPRDDIDPKIVRSEAKGTSPEMNEWIESLFS